MIRIGLAERALVLQAEQATHLTNQVREARTEDDSKRVRLAQIMHAREMAIQFADLSAAAKQGDNT